MSEENWSFVSNVDTTSRVKPNKKEMEYYNESETESVDYDKFMTWKEFKNNHGMPENVKEDECITSNEIKNLDMDNNE
jgi:hypothetical protein